MIFQWEVRCHVPLLLTEAGLKTLRAVTHALLARNWQVEPDLECGAQPPREGWSSRSEALEQALKVLELYGRPGGLA
jgi:hypothetical protein